MSVTGAVAFSPSRDLIQRTRSAEEAPGVLAAAKPAHPKKWIFAEER
jgi:hypothetical protein